MVRLHVKVAPFTRIRKWVSSISMSGGFMLPGLEESLHVQIHGIGKVVSELDVVCVS